MEQQYHEYQLRLLTLAPVHIGDGEKYSAKNYIYEDNQYYFPNMGKLYLNLNNQQKESFEGFLASPRHDRLIDFLHQENIANRDFGGYKIKATGFETEKHGRLNEIQTFVKDPYGNPYIPGSSLKGALRTILVNEKFKTDQINWGGNDDIFNEIRVSDSDPIDFEKLAIVQKWDLNRKKTDPKALPLFREALMPMTKVNFTITTSTERAAKLIDSLMECAKQFYRRYHERFLKDFLDSYLQKNVRAPLYLGAGSGLWSKVDHHNVDIRQIQRRTPRKMKMKGNGVLKLTKYAQTSYFVKKNGERVKWPTIRNKFGYYEMGKCGFKIIEKM